VRPVLGAVERKVASRSGLLPEWRADAHLRTDPRLAKTSSGEQGAHVSPIRMPRSDRACRSESKLPDGHLEPFFYPARPTARFACGQLWHLFPRFLSGRGLFADQSLRLARGRRRRFGAQLVLPIEVFLLRLEAREITSANRATPGTGA